MLRTTLFTFLIVTLAACENAPFSAQEKDISEFNDLPVHSASLEDGRAQAPQAGRKMIWSADLEFQVQDMDASTKVLTALATKAEGFVSGMKRTSSNYRIENRITMRVPNDRFDALVEQVQGQATFLDKVDINSNDVTEEFVDIEHRLVTKKAARDRYIEILNTKTGEVKDIIAAEEAIRKITEEIEAKEGRLRFLKDKVKFSTISVLIYQEVDHQQSPVVFHEPYSQKLTAAFGGGWSAITGVVIMLVYIWPVLVVLAALFIWKRKRWYGKKEVSTGQKN